MDRPAWRTLSVGARALLIELRSLYHGRNNGELFLAVREAALRLRGATAPVSKDTASRWFWELEDRGWIKPKVPVGFNQKSAARERMATCWILTEYPTPGAAPTREFATWEGPPREKPKTIRRSDETDSLSHHKDSLSRHKDSPPETVAPQGQIRPKRPPNAPRLSHHKDTDSYHGDGKETQ